MTTSDQLPDATSRIHATAFAIANQCVLIRGPSGSGKSDLALRCLSTPPSELQPGVPALVADDQIILERTNETIIARAPETVFGKLEVRGIGILDVTAIPAARVRLVCDLVAPELVPRLPDDGETTEIHGISVPSIKLAPFEASAPLKLLIKLARQLKRPTNENLIT